MTTIKDVAKILNLSITTVSRALDGYDDVAENTRQLVIETAREMGYVPNRAARQLRRQKAETIGFILPAIAKRFNEPFFTEFISGLGEALSGQNFDLLVANATSDEMERNLYQRWVNSRKVDGFVLNRIRKKDWRVQMLAAANIPFTAYGKSQDGVDYPHIRLDGAQGYTDLVSHLVASGFTRPAFIGGPQDLMSHMERLQWLKLALGKNNLPFDPLPIVLADMTSAGGYEAAKDLLTRAQPPNAILCINDETAFGALHAAHECRMNVGTDIAIAGFDGVQDSLHTEPPLTTLDVPVYAIARQLVIMLLALINGEPLTERQVKIQPKLLIRESTGG
jgi:DNA-binding LacI/PurR family transcriptional regulator